MLIEFPTDWNKILTLVTWSFSARKSLKTNSQTQQELSHCFRTGSGEQVTSDHQCLESLEHLQWSSAIGMVSGKWGFCKWGLWGAVTLMSLKVRVKEGFICCLIISKLWIVSTRKCLRHLEKHKVLEDGKILFPLLKENKNPLGIIAVIHIFFVLYLCPWSANLSTFNAPFPIPLL